MDMKPHLQLTEDDVLEVVKVNKANEYADILPFILNMGFPEIYYDGFALQKREFIVYASKIFIYNDKEKIVRYSGGYAGTSVRIAKGLTIHQGARKGTPIRENVREFIDGDLIITNKRVVFVAEKGNFEFKVDKLTACKISAKNSFILQSGNKSKNIVADENVIKYIVAFINTILSSYVDEVDMYDEYLDSQKLITPELQQAYDDAKKEIRLLIESKNIKTNTTTKFTFLRYFIGFIMMLSVPMFISTNEASVISGICYGILGFLITPIGNKQLFGKKRFILAIIFFILFGLYTGIHQGKIKTKETKQIENIDTIKEVSKKQLHISEIINIENHPKIGDSFDSVVNFKKKINDDRIKALEVEEKARIDWSLTKETDDTNILYLEKDPTHGKFLGAVEIKIYNKEFANTLDVNKALDILRTYLPVDFSKHYKKDTAYIIDNNVFTKYVYSVRLNKDGIDFHNNKKAHYSYYMALYIQYNKDNGYWKIYTNYSAFGDKDLGWIEQYAQPWNINLNK
ncbi:MAG: hypothetical protein IKV03_05700 [Alphaproteobacteria bacterium]|nr:hypothetical protein [Alphaproteobacteria bacterium]